jgi:hypothetical protein
MWEGMVKVQRASRAKAIRAGASTIFKIADVFDCLVLMRLTIMPANMRIRKFSLRVAILSLWTRKKMCHTFKQQKQGAPHAH